MANSEVQNAPAIEETADQLGSPDAQEGQDDDWSPNDLNEEQRAAYDTAMKAVDAFIENHPTYKPTDDNRQAILDYLDEHALAISPASLELCWEQLGDRLDLGPEQRDSNKQPDSDDRDSDESDASVRLATAGLARKSKSDEEPPESDESEPEEEPGRGEKQPVGWRNGRRLEVGA